MKITKTPSGKYTARVPMPPTPDGKRRWKSITRDTKREVQLAAAEYQLQPKDAPALGKVEDLCKRYIDLKAPVLSPSTVRSYKTALKRIQGTRLGETEMQRVTSPIVQEWIGLMATEVSPKTVRNLYALFTSTAALFAPNMTFRVKLPQKIRPRLHTPSSAEVIRLLDAFRAEGDEVMIRAILISAGCGLRRGEICALDAEDVDRERCLITVTRDMVRSEHGFVIKDAPKTDTSNRVVPVPKQVLDLLPEEGPIIGIAPSRISERFHKMTVKLGQTFRFHDLRSYWVTILMYAGVDARTLQELGGWSTDVVMKRVYIRTIEEEKQKRMNQVSGLIIEKLQL